MELKEKKIMDKQKFGNLLVQLRKENNLTQQSFAELFHVSFQAVSKWENGESLPDISTLEQISKFYGISMNHLLNGEREEKIIEKKTIEYKEDKDINNSFKTKFVKQRLIKLITCSVVLGIYLILCFIPFANVSFDYGYISLSIYKLIFSSNYQSGNFILLMSFLSFISSCTIGIISVFYEKNTKLIGIEESLLIGSFVFYITLAGSIFSNAAGGLFVITIFLIAYLCFFLFSKSLNYNVLFLNRKQKYFDLIGIYSIILISIFSINISDGSNGLYLLFYLFLFIFYISSLVFFILSFFKENKVFVILQIVFLCIVGISFIIFCMVYGLIFVMIYYIAYIIIRTVRIKKYKNRQMLSCEL